MREYFYFLFQSLQHNSFLTVLIRVFHCRIKAKNPLRFQRTSLFLRVLGILELHHFRLPVCRFVIDLFDKKVMRQIVLEEDIEDGELEDSADEEVMDGFDGEAGEGRDVFGGRGSQSSGLAGIERVDSERSERSQVLTDEELDEDEALFGEGDGLGRVESGVNLGRVEDMNATAILRGER